MLAKLKINTAALICLTFVFKLLFLNIGLAASLYTHHPVATKKQYSSSPKKRNSVEVADNTKDGGYTTTEICEENSTDNEKPFKLTAFSLTHVFYSRVESKLKDTLKKITPFNKYFSYDSSNRYLEYRVFRI